jgi:ATP-dependent helicase/nuclease subunit B
MRGRQLRPSPERPHPRVAIWGPREARVQGADLMILAGLNDGVWPAAADPGPWLSRPMHAAIGLAPPEHVVGLAAHDFLQGACQGRVLLTRARKVDGVPTVASRWLIRLETLVVGIGAGDAMRAMRDRVDRYLELARRLGRPEARDPAAPRPAPAPPLGARPRRLSVTDIERLIRDAYSIYAKHVLGLKPLEPLGRPADARERGSIVHRIMERFAARTLPWPGPEAARAALMAAADEVLAEDVPWPDLRRAWRARIVRFADWFIETEAARRGAGEPLAWEAHGLMTLHLPGGPFEVTARADRIDRHRDGRAAIYDYKTGQPPTGKVVDTGFAQQIHVQAAMLERGAFEGLPAMETACGAYIGLTGSSDGGRLTEVETTPARTARHMAELEQLLSAYDAGAPYLALGRVESIRTPGDYDHLARRAEWWGADE